jgi:hypothetical protein
VPRVEALIVRSEISDLEMQPFWLLFGVAIVSVFSTTAEIAEKDLGRKLPQSKKSLRSLKLKIEVEVSDGLASIRGHASTQIKTLRLNFLILRIMIIKMCLKFSITQLFSQFW